MKLLNIPRTPVAIIGEYSLYSFIRKPKKWRQGDYIMQEYLLTYMGRIVRRMKFPMHSDLQHRRVLNNVLNKIV